MARTQRIVILLLISLPMLLLACGSNKGKQELPPNADSLDIELANFPIDSLNYAIGLTYSSFYEQNDVLIDVASLTKGIKDGVNKKPKITDEQTQWLVMRYNRLQAQIERRDNARKSTAFLDSVAQLEGVMRDESGLLYSIETPGEGKTPVDTSLVKCHYTLYMMDGRVLESTEGSDPVTFPLDKVISGWTIGLQLIKEGGKIRLYVPSNLGYGDYAPEQIGPGNALIFDVELLEVVEQKEKLAEIAQ